MVLINWNTDMGDGWEWSNAAEYPGLREVHRAGLPDGDQRNRLLADALMHMPDDHSTDDSRPSPSASPPGASASSTEIRKVIVGQDEVIEQVLMALFTGGHCLITGVPGPGQDAADQDRRRRSSTSSFKRIQFTPDLMPADITGTEVLDEEHGHRSLRFVKGPIFAQIILADEINRTPPKTQAALLEAMQEYHVTAAGPDLSARAAVLRAGDAEPDRARRHLSAARGAARSLHVQHRHDLPRPRTTRCGS